VIGVDLGGTKTLAGIVDRAGAIHARHEIETPAGSESEVVAALDAVVERFLDDRVVAVGYGVPSNLERGTYRILGAVNLPLDDFDLLGHARSRFGLPAGVENDGNAAALAEWKLGAGKGATDLVVLTLGTGVGGGLVLDGQLYRGWAELGHMVLQVGGPPCHGNCHGHGHIEAFVSGTAADGLAARLFGTGADARTLVDAAQGGDAKAQAALAEVGRLLGAAIGSLANAFGLEVAVVGGGFGEAAEGFLLDVAEVAAREEAVSPADARLRVLSAELGTDAGLIGAALVAFEAIDGSR
jgi:glucokinase